MVDRFQELPGFRTIYPNPPPRGIADTIPNRSVRRSDVVSPVRHLSAERDVRDTRGGTSPHDQASPPTLELVFRHFDPSLTVGWLVHSVSRASPQ